MPFTPSRRGLIAGLAVGAAAASVAPAQKSGAMWSGDYWAEKGPVRLYLYRKRQGAPVAGRSDKPVVMLVHGSTISGRSSFDLKAGPDDFSMMDALVRAGFDVWTMDHENYGRSSRTDSNSDVASGAEDLRAAMRVITRETGRAKIHFYGESSGALRAGLYANQAPETVDRLIFAAFTYTGVGAPTLIQRAKQLDFYRTNNRRPRDRAMIASIFTRDGGHASPAVVEALIKAELGYGDSVPTGTYLDMTSKLPLVDPLKVTMPVMLIRGDQDGIATMDDILNFYRAVPASEKQLTVVPGTHDLVHGAARTKMWHSVIDFLGAPAVAA